MADDASRASLAEHLAGAGLVHVDARVFALHLTDTGPTRQTELAFSGIASGSIKAQTSSLTLYQVLVEVYRQGKPTLARDVARHMRLYPRLGIVAASSEIAIQAAEVRARLGGRPERALQIATALVSGAEVYLTSGSGLRRIAGMRVLNVEDLSEE
ncbi:MAG: PIN domain-containing protein [Gemmatimonadetes bacterium]|nr:PIN domain-containing protein [Candidatus Palauibacter irciniicola]MYC19682.1 PIN domain-containing protein [Gemmatimonadales bacterium]MYI45069.1 PIN domain-containing protein [Gemmatimonadota bacterium]